MLYEDIVKLCLEYEKCSLEELWKKSGNIEKLSSEIPKNPSNEFLFNYYTKTDFVPLLVRKEPYLWQFLRDLNTLRILIFLGKRKVLDYGCGAGITGLRLAMNGIDVTSTDLDGDTLKFVKWSHKNYTNSKIVRLNDLDNNEKYDAITCFDVFEHLDNPIPLISIFYKMLNENGLLIFTHQITGAKDEPAHIAPVELLPELEKEINKHFSFVEKLALNNQFSFELGTYPAVMIKKEL